MGLFSFLKRKPEPPARTRAGAEPRRDSEPAAAPAPRDPVRARAGGPGRHDSEAARARQREIARATAAKIDAIELEMASDMFSEEPAWGRAARRAPAAAAAVPVYEFGASDAAAGPGAPAIPPVAEEAAVLYANGESQAAERALRGSLIGDGRNQRLPWWMLLDLYQAGGREQDFESLAIDYAIHFESAPPVWKNRTASSPQPQFAGIAPTEAFSGVLGPHIEPQLQRLRDCSAASPVLRLEFGGVRGATPDGCACLLDGLRALRNTRSELVLGSADTLAGVLRPMLTIGDRGASQIPWLLLLELLQLTDRAKDFEETAMDFRVTFETEPPPFTAPLRVATAATSATGGDRFLLPATVEGDAAALLASIETYARASNPAVLDCSRLARIDTPCAEALQGQLRALKAEGRNLELRDLNNLVAPLLRLLGAADSARLFATKY
ncbi:MAG: STAS domain-containing protein [Telluria sp.]